MSLNRAAAVAMADGPQSALALIDALAADAISTAITCSMPRGPICRVGSSEEAAKSYARALALVTNDAERRYLERRLREVQSPRNT